MEGIFIFTGMMTFGILLLSVLAFIITVAKEITSSIIYQHRRKHRFDKKPTAKCYCVDCKYYGDGYVPKRYCSVLNRSMLDDQFCSIGIPRKQSKED